MKLYRFTLTRADGSQFEVDMYLAPAQVPTFERRCMREMASEGAILTTEVLQ